MPMAFNRDEPDFDTVHQVSDHLYTYLTHFLFNGKIPLNNRSIVVHLPTSGKGELLIINPSELTPKVLTGLKDLEQRTGAKIRHLLSPGDWHYMFIGAYITAFPGSTAYVAPGRIPSKKPTYPYTLVDISLDHPLPQFAPHLDVLTFRGMVDFEDPAKKTPRYEFVFYHPESATITAADVFMFSGVGAPTAAWTAMGLRFGVLEFHFMREAITLNGAELEASLAKVLTWKPENYICQHGGLGNMIHGKVHEQVEDLRRWAKSLRIPAAP